MLSEYNAPHSVIIKKLSLISNHGRIVVWLLLGGTTFDFGGCIEFAIGYALELPTALKIAIWMAHTLAIPKTVALLDIILTCMCDLKYTRTCNVIMLRLGRVENFFDLGRIGNAIA